MKKRLEDRLIELAFDDANGSVPAEIASTPEANVRLNEYRMMRSALGQLRELPDHQLSTERLREALLHQGLKRRFHFPWQSLGYGATACALFLCAFVVGRQLHRRSGDPTIVEGKKATDSFFVQAASSPFEFIFGSGGNAASPSTSEVNTSTSPSVHHAARRSGDGFSNARLVASLVPSGSKTLLAPTAGYTISDRRLGVGLSAAPSGALRDLSTNSPTVVDDVNVIHPPVTEAIVMIQPRTDAATGLDTAMEVKGTNDVLVGG